MPKLPTGHVKVFRPHRDAPLSPQRDSKAFSLSNAQGPSSSQNKDITLKSKTPLNLHKDMYEMPDKHRLQVSPSSLHKDMVSSPETPSKMPKHSSNMPNTDRSSQVPPSSRHKNMGSTPKTPSKLPKGSSNTPNTDSSQVSPSSLHKDVASRPEAPSKPPKDTSNKPAAPPVAAPIKNFASNTNIPYGLRKNVLGMIKTGGAEAPGSSSEAGSSPSDDQALVRRADDFQTLQLQKARRASGSSGDGSPYLSPTRRDLLAQTIRLVSGNMEPKKSRRTLIPRAGGLAARREGHQGAPAFQRSKSDIGPLTAKSRLTPQPSAPLQRSRSAPNLSNPGSKKESHIPGLPPVLRMPKRHPRYTFSEGDSPKSSGYASSYSNDTPSSTKSDPSDFFSPGSAKRM